MRPLILELQESKIRELANQAMGRADVLAFWFGESDEVTPEFITSAAIDSLKEGETFYTHNLGLPELRESLAHEMSKRHGQGRFGIEHIAVTSGGVSALMIAAQALISPLDKVVAITPLWPNLTAQAMIMGAHLNCVPLIPKGGAWGLDIQALLDALTASVKVLLINAPNNPTGWTMQRGEQEVILEHCRKLGIWIVADEVYENLYFEPSTNGCAPSFLDIAQDEDRVMVIHSFSKSFLMTGWRLGWIVAPSSTLPSLGKLIEFNTSCASLFTQRAGVVAIRRSQEVTPRVVSHLKFCRDTLCEGLMELDQLELSKPSGGMYAFFKIKGKVDSLNIAKQLVHEAGLGIAPGVAFAQESKDWFRWCFASKDPQRLLNGVERLRKWLG